MRGDLLGLGPADGPVGAAMLTIMVASAQRERDIMTERTRPDSLPRRLTEVRVGGPRTVDEAERGEGELSSR